MVCLIYLYKVLVWCLCLMENVHLTSTPVQDEYGFVVATFGLKLESPLFPIYDVLSLFFYIMCHFNPSGPHFCEVMEVAEVFRERRVKVSCVALELMCGAVFCRLNLQCVFFYQIKPCRCKTSPT